MPSPYLSLTSIALFALLGLSIGSFINVVAYRLPHMLLDDSYSKNLSFPRSHCCGCQTQLCWYQLLPVISYLMLRGRCHYCQVSIGLQHPLVELLCGILVVNVVIQYGANVSSLLILTYVCALLTLLLIDAKHYLLPDTITLPLLWLGLLFNISGSITSLANAVLGAATGYSFFWLLHYAYLCLRKKNGLGLGDAKLCAAIGAWIGVWQLPMMICIAAISALLFAGLQLLRGKMTCEQALPFGPFLAIAGWAILWFNH